MQGVIIWYSRADFQAIIWCEDSKDLGIATGPTAWRNPMCVVDVGDAVTFRLDTANPGRRCTDVQLVATAAAPSLRASITPPRSAPKTSKNRLLHLCVTPD